MKKNLFLSATFLAAPVCAMDVAQPVQQKAHVVVQPMTAEKLTDMFTQTCDMLQKADPHAVARYKQLFTVALGCINAARKPKYGFANAELVVWAQTLLNSVQDACKKMSTDDAGYVAMRAYEKVATKLVLDCMPQ